jgi:hypothetical protein
VILSDACIRFSPDGPAGVDASLHLSGSSFIYCHTYPEAAPILSVRDRHVSVRVTVPDSGRVTPQDLDTAQRLADAVAAYFAELGARMAVQDLATDEGEAA